MRLGSPIDLFDGGGFAYYWRPLTRQAYYMVLGDVLLQAPWLAAALHAVALAGLAALMGDIGRRSLPRSAALSLALLPLVAESARLLLVWPTCAQPLFGAFFAAAAITAALAGRGVLAGVALLAGLLSYEQAIAAVPVLAAIAWHRSPMTGVRIRAVFPIGLALLVWGAGLAAASSHGVRWLTVGTPAEPGPAIAYATTVLANVDLLGASARTLLLVAQGALIVAAAALVWRRRRTRPGDQPRPGPSPGVFAGCAAIGLLGLIPALLAPTVWAPRHAFLPSLFLGYAVIGLCARAGAAFAPFWIVLRTIALLLAPTASAIVDEPVGDARTSFRELVRLQRIVAATREGLDRTSAARAGGASYWSALPRSAVAFADGKAQAVWAGDSTFRWAWLQRPIRSERQRSYPVLSFDSAVPDPVLLVDPAVIDAYFLAVDGSSNSDPARMDSILEAASLRNGRRPEAVLDEIERLRAGLAAIRGDVALAESLNTSSVRRTGMTANHVAIAGWVALAR